MTETNTKEKPKATPEQIEDARTKIQAAIYEMLCGSSKIAPYAYPLVGMRQVYNYSGVDTAAVMLNKKTLDISLILNPHFVLSLPKQKLIGLLKHEALHLYLSHLNRKADDSKINEQTKLSVNDYRKLENIAEDMSINNYIESDILPDGGVTVDAVSKAIGKDIEPMRSKDYYFDLLYDVQKSSESQKKIILNMKTTDDHDAGKGEGGDGSGTDEDGNEYVDLNGDGNGIGESLKRELVRQFIQERVNQDGAKKVINSLKQKEKEEKQKRVEAGKEFGGSGIGNIASNIEREFTIIFGDQSVNWRRELNNIIGSVGKSVLREQTRKIRNRRLGLKVPGVKSLPVTRVFIGVDNSGSIDRDALNILMGEVDRISRANMSQFKVAVVSCDTAVNTRNVFRKDKTFFSGSDMKKYAPIYSTKDIKISGGGGTKYSPMLDEARRLKADICIILGDMECFDNELDFSELKRVVFMKYGNLSVDNFKKHYVSEKDEKRVKVYEIFDGGSN